MRDLDEAAEGEVVLDGEAAHEGHADPRAHVAFHGRDAAELHDDVGVRKMLVEQRTSRRAPAERHERRAVRGQAGRGDEDELIVDPGLSFWMRDHAEIDLPALERIEHLARRRLAKAKPHAGVRRPERRERGRQEVRARCRAGAEPHFAGFEALDLGDGPHGITHGREDVQHARQKDAARGRQARPGAIAMKEPRAERFFEPLDRRRERGLREVGVPRGPRERPVFSDEGEVPKGIQHQPKLSRPSEQSIGSMAAEPLPHASRR